MIHLKGKKALITGGSRGIGRATAVLFARAGADVAISYASRSSAAEEVQKQITNVWLPDGWIQICVGKYSPISDYEKKWRTVFP